MNIQNIIVALILAAAFVYVGLIFWRKMKAFKPKNSCGANDCGCDTKADKS